MRRLFCWCLVLGLAGAAQAQALPEGTPMLLTTEAQRALLETARTDLLYLRLDKAEATLTGLYRAGGQAAALHHLATAALLRGFLTDHEPAFDRFVERSDSLKAFLTTQPETRWRVLLEAETDLQRAIVWGRREQFTRAALAARSALRGFERAAEGVPQWAEPRKGLGLMHVVIGSLPSGYRRLLSVLGYRGTVEQGRRELVQAATKGQYVAEEARLMLAITDVIVRARAADAVAAMRPLYRQHPRAPLVAHFYAYALLSDRRADEAARAYAPVVEAREAGQVPLVYATFYYADARFKQNRFEEAARLFQQYLRRHRGPSLRAAALLGAARALEMSGRRDEALPLYRQIRHTRTSETEELAVRAARRHLAAPMTQAEQTLLRAANALEGGRPAEATALLGPLGDGALSPREQAWQRYLSGRAAHLQDQLNEAVVAYKQVIDAPGPDPLDGLAAWSHFYTGQIYAARGQRAAARVQFEAALAHKGHFDRYLSLEQYVRTALEGVR